MGFGGAAAPSLSVPFAIALADGFEGLATPTRILNGAFCAVEAFASRSEIALLIRERYVPAVDRRVRLRAVGFPFGASSGAGYAEGGAGG